MYDLNPHMSAGERLFRSYVEHHFSKAYPNLKPVVDDWNWKSEDCTFGSEAIKVRATDRAIYVIGTQGNAALQRLDGHRGLGLVLPAIHSTASVLIDADDRGEHLVIAKPAFPYQHMNRKRDDRGNPEKCSECGHTLRVHIDEGGRRVCVVCRRSLEKGPCAG